MKIEEVPLFLRNEYIMSCKCGKNHKMLTQRNNFPEYETEIYLQCECGEYVECILPVN